MKYSVHCGTPPACGGVEKKGWHLWNSTVLPKRARSPAAAVVAAEEELGQGFEISAFGRVS